VTSGNIYLRIFKLPHHLVNAETYPLNTFLYLHHPVKYR